jgi:hypothetical protein
MKAQRIGNNVALVESVTFRALNACCDANWAGVRRKH